MVLLNPPHYVVNLVRKTSAWTFISDNNLDYFVNSSQIEFQGRIYCSTVVTSFFLYKLEIKFSEAILSDYLGLITLSPVSSTELKVGNHKCTIIM